MHVVNETVAITKNLLEQISDSQKALFLMFVKTLEKYKNRF